jgi:hypothetical protein
LSAIAAARSPTVGIATARFGACRVGVGGETAAAAVSTPPRNSLVRWPVRPGGPAPAQPKTIATSANDGRELRREVGKRRDNDGPQKQEIAQPWACS